MCASERTGGDVESGGRDAGRRTLACAPEPADGDVLIPYGKDASRALVHISEVAASGLACGCSCLVCGAALVAHRGPERAHHFQHHSDTACGGGWETALHRLAKEVVLGARAIRLPEAVAQLGERVRMVSPGGLWRCEEAEAEVPMGDVTPDVVLRRDGRELLVEFEVTHACDEAKRAKLRERGLASVEVDLSRVPRDASRAEHVAAILRGAPRSWIFNARLAEAEAGLREEAERHEAAVRRSRERLYGRVADELSKAWVSPPKAGHPSWHRLAPHAGLGECVGEAVPGDQCFAVDTTTWQAALIDFALVRVRWQRFTADAALAQLHRLEMLKAPFWRRGWEPGLVALAAERMPGFRPPAEVVADYADRLAARGVLRRTRKGWRADRDWARRASEGLEKARLAAERLGLLRRAVDALSEGAAEAEAVAIRGWASMPLPDGTLSPVAIASAGGEAWDELSRRLVGLVAMTRPGGEALPPADLLGLPLHAHRRAREAEARRREEARRRVREELDRHDEERRRREAREFLDGILEWATEVLGPEAGRAWVREALRREAGLSPEEAGRDLPVGARRRVRQAWTLEADRIQSQRDAERRREEAAEAADSEARRCRALLEEAARRRFARGAQPVGVAAEDRATLWLRGRQRSLGRSPLEHCVDQRTLEECLPLLDPACGAASARR